MLSTKSRRCPHMEDGLKLETYLLIVWLKVKNNQQSFLPTIHLPSSSEMISVHIDPFFEVLHHVGFMLRHMG